MKTFFRFFLFTILSPLFFFFIAVHGVSASSLFAFSTSSPSYQSGNYAYGNQVYASTTIVVSSVSIPLRRVGAASYDTFFVFAVRATSTDSFYVPAYASTTRSTQISTGGTVITYEFPEPILIPANSSFIVWYKGYSSASYYIQAQYFDSSSNDSLFPHTFAPNAFFVNSGSFPTSYNVFTSVLRYRVVSMSFYGDYLSSDVPDSSSSCSALVNTSTSFFTSFFQKIYNFSFL